MNKRKIDQLLKKALPKKRYQHTMNVVEVAKSLAVRYNCNVKKASLAALLHDCAKNFSDEELIKYAEANGVRVDSVSRHDPQLLHGPVGAIVAENTYGVQDKTILNAIRYHTTGRKNMSKLEKIIYLADFIEPGRTFPGMDKLKSLAFEDLDQAVIMALSDTIRYVALSDALIHKRTITARNDLIIKKMQKNII
ncbi:bis(5'-nucleosyl)-tetraphosphatase (symmetrical) YqeK [Acetobacterium bakii]|uniref:bis(5'-nucleosyl)-tetraphosphatase (symmetrical) n=1 Tax=Acetobacterium bakii TaxID=52689 RepID=A0A0L6TZI6_9FIRM|nr:bis(5'-nucleosyl)-tetraphosphatase (symmetrical) YqeK [Acetobacterium bakii]KNZ40970.1 phosphohydrolase [Acetobacterium bakii]